MNRACATAFILVLATPVAAQQKRPSVAPKAMQEVAPQLATYTDDVLFGDVWVRSQLSPRDRSMVTLTVLIGTGKSAQLAGHLNRALDNGVTPAEVSGLVTQLAFYTGWPNAVSALAVIAPEFTKRKIDTAALRAAVSAAALAPEQPATARDSNPAMAKGAPKFEALTANVIYGDLWRRTDLTPRDRSLVTIIALAANGDEAQLASHMGRSAAYGLTRADLVEALTHLAFYAGWPKANSAIRLAIADQGKPAEPVVSADAAPPLTVTPPRQDPSRGPAEHFTGQVTVTSPFKASGGSRLGGATVSFAKGARTNWHTHPTGQLLVVTTGRGWVQAAGEPVRVVGPGDIVWTAPGVRHWHGATATSAMTHVAASESREGTSVTWMEPVSAAQYTGPR
ncbi:(R)-mandelonitrile lyase [Sphingomonas ginsenosidivorax]|uniref:(R)-mandelonitrile lyase n=1 Tax=Sphingomonas ginsenosidivorax TaxID=862135 RepID=UPI001315270B|nr:carboxymuconolactone decarboxylase family protein [Sphingomonas ginsenosidivorax]